MAFDFLKRLTSPWAANGMGRDGSARSAESGGTRIVTREGEFDGGEVVQRRHVDFIEHEVRWRFFLDSYEGGDRYRNAVYGPDRKGFPCRNLFRHRREYPDPGEFPVLANGYAGYLATSPGEATTAYGPYPGMLGADGASTAMDDDYELRRSRTPVPEFVSEAVEIHLGHVYSQEIARKGPPELVEWWKDVDGAGTPIDDWMRETVAPLLLVLGCLDICFDHPVMPPGEKVTTRFDELRLGLDKCVASYILPQNMLWWKCDPGGRYTHCLVREYMDPSERCDVGKNGRVIDADDPGKVGEAWRKNFTRFRFWTATEWIVFDYAGSQILDRRPHNFGRVPIIRLIDLRKHRTRTVGKSRYEAVAELQREFYNRDSELILSDTLQAHPLLSGPDDYCKADNTLSIGPGYILPKKKSTDGGTHYEGWEYTSPPKDPAESLRKNKEDLVNAKDRRACLTKPAGHAHGSGGQGTSVVGQSGIAKQLDAAQGHKLLTSISKSLSKSERFMGEMALLVLRKGKPLTPKEREGIAAVYPARFELCSAEELIEAFSKVQLTWANAGEAPRTEGLIYKSIIRQLLLGLPDEEYTELDDEIDTMLKAKAQIEEGGATLPVAGNEDDAEEGVGPGSEESDAGQDPSGESAGTMVGNVVPTVV